jgi:hypothetical protein
MRSSLLRLFQIASVLLLATLSASAQDPPEKKFEEFNKVIAGAKTFDGLFKLHLKEEHLYLELRPDQLDKPYLAPISIARGMGMGGHTLNFEEQWVLLFKRVNDKIQVIRRNVRFAARLGSPISKAVETTYTDSVLFSVPIKTINPTRSSVVFDLQPIFMSNFADLPLGFLDQNRSTWQKVKAFPKNVEIQVAATFNGRGTGDDVIDPRGNTVVIQYGLVELPDGLYQPRLADDRIGHFITAVKDFTSDSRDTAYVRYVNRWRLERVDSSPWKEGAKLVPPKKKIVFWIEKSVPDEYRAAVREGILEWNKAFEKIGFREAIEVRQQETEDFDPEDVTYNTFRWITNDQGYAMGPSRANPFTGELMDADIVFDASMVRYFKQERQLFKNARGEAMTPPSQIEAVRKGWGIQTSLLQGWNDRPITDTALPDELRLRAIRQGLCQCGSHKSFELGLGHMAMLNRVEQKGPENLNDEMVLQAIKEVTMHEVGHTLGLRHNFKGSTFLKSDQLHNKEITSKQGLGASVMDYSPVNLAPKGTKQGDFFSTTLGVYDYWAIEYAYKPLSGGTEGEREELQKIASRCAEPGLVYATDEDLMTADPNVNVWDLGSDPMKYGQERMLLAEELLKGLAERVVEKGEGYQRARLAFGLMLRQYGDAAFLTSQFIGGEYLYRDHRGDKDARDPFVPVEGAKQREALKFLQEHILTDKPFQFPPELLRRLAADRWLHWGNEMNVFQTNFSINDRILEIQRIVLRNLLASSTLYRLQSLAAKADSKDNPMTVAEIFRALSDSIFLDLPNGDKAANAKSSVIRRNLQRDYLRQLSNMVLRGNVPADARSLARMHLREISKRIDQATNGKGPALEDTVKAHLEESKEQIAKVLTANVTGQE